ncbi:hypothetical protein C8F04DRAFT_240315 [Mycena alexandri]|uniref:Uncharacterized protein n=1 Tax=Mycena alexandri TaxID=1745969 RepID=A0AAD6S947_9AGAR|nr:hypothetical protein C8F04DRAFT_240315 [Mycena alexandri]
MGPSSPSPPTMLRAHLLLSLVVFCQTVHTAEMKHFIDDFSSLAVYQGAALNRSLAGFSPSEIKDGTVTLVTASGSDSATISMNFTGNGVYVYVAYPSDRPALVPSAFSTQIDGVPAGGWARGNFSDPLSAFVAYENTTLSNNTHNFVIEVQPGWELYFDFVVYTSFVPDSSSASSSASARATSNQPVALSRMKKQAPVGAIAGGVIGGIVLLVLLSTPFLLRRRAVAKSRAIPKQTPVPFIDGHGDKHSSVGKDSSLPPPTPFTLRAPRRFRPTKSVPESSTHDYPTVGDEAQSPMSPASDPSLLLVAAEVRRLTASMQRLETGIPEAHDGGPVVFQHPPAYGSRMGESN